MVINKIIQITMQDNSIFHVSADHVVQLHMNKELDVITNTMPIPEAKKHISEEYEYAQTNRGLNWIIQDFSWEELNPTIAARGIPNYHHMWKSSTFPNVEILSINTPTQPELTPTNVS